MIESGFAIYYGQSDGNVKVRDATYVLDGLLYVNPTFASSKHYTERLAGVRPDAPGWLPVRAAHARFGG